MGDDNKVMRKIGSKDVPIFRLFDYKSILAQNILIKNHVSSIYAICFLKLILWIVYKK